MKCVLITRFAMRFKDSRYERDDWVDYRMGLFHKYCLPSVQAQTFKDFDWLFLIHPEYPGFTDSHRDELSRYGNVIWIDAPWKEKQLEVGELLSSRYKSWVCSMRLDSDDIIRNDYLELAMQKVTEQEAWISFPNGYMMKDNHIFKRHYLANPFLLHVEYADPFHSVYRVNHIHMRKDSLRRNIPMKIVDDCGWIQVDHGDNIKNRIQRKLDLVETDFTSIPTNFTWRSE